MTSSEVLSTRPVGCPNVTFHIVVRRVWDYDDLISLSAVVVTSHVAASTTASLRFNACCKIATRFHRNVHLTVQFPPCSARHRRPYSMASNHRLKSKYNTSQSSCVKLRCSLIGCTLFTVIRLGLHYLALRLHMCAYVDSQ